ncbi:MAG TPA: hypothetical protein VFW23_14485 [Tepidisphaeraceae bacterium]|nr:hypothetical protein [Tepidisphaeraceae bacterium]
MLDEVIELDLGVVPEAAVSGAVCLQTELVTILTFNAMRPTDRISPYGGPYLEDAGTAVVNFTRCLISRFGYPNDEPRSGIPLYKSVDYGIYEVLNSTWIREVVRMNRYSFPKTEDDCVKRHFLFGFHDSTFECLADDLDLQVVNEPYDVIFERIRRRAFNGK